MRASVLTKTKSRKKKARAMEALTVYLDNV